ncbi:transglutaminaseTgpA domain-containing protein [Halorussus marinus]|uniref:transglutaminaseTgpA domain-containing protein n=1 Tax=Halorussus marinus TaxID=2505976 RepID=UPI001092C7FC|nr:transglutaminaseTgpA domain-containing protein [Halorussus marinus]
MTDTSPSLVPDDEQSRDRLRTLLVVCCVAAVALAAIVVPAVSSSGLGDSPLGSTVPQPNADPYDAAPAGSGGGAGALSGGGSLGALNPGERTDVGGPLASDGASAFRSQNAAVHFTVRASAKSYWRTGAYDTYTGAGWERSGEPRPYTGPLGGEGIAGERVEYRVRLNQSATALPSVWRPESISGVDSPLVTDRRAFASETALPAGTTYTGVSHRPPQDPTLLRTAGREYPDEIESRYTALPEDTERRLAPFTANLTADADSPYGTATRIESWLEANKSYSLNASRPGEDAAAEFVFEMEQGYCEYFATSMTAMLRSQGVPARYVVGYSTGQQVGPNTYEVRGMNAHAWVEVYFPEVGWVRFDPTPGSDRLRAEQAALENRTGETDYDPVEEGSPNETFSAEGTVTPGAGQTGGDGVGTATGATADATAGGSTAGPATEGGSDGTADGEPGTATDPGASTGTPDGSGATADDAGGTQSGESGGEESGSDETTGGEATETTGDGSSEPGETTDDAEDTDDTDGTDETDSSEKTDETDNSEEIDETDGADETAAAGYDVSLNRTPVPGATVTATVARDGSPASGVEVLFNGEPVGTTDDAGRVSGEVPYARNLTVTVREVSRTAAVGSLAFDRPASVSTPPGALSVANETNGSRSYALETNATLTVSGEIVTGGEVVVTATVDDVPLRNADVRVGGERVAETDRRGRAEIRLPDSPGPVTVAASRGPVSGETTVELPALNVTAEPSLPVALPATGVEVSANYDGEPVANASVAVGGADLTTGVDGTVTARLPFASSADVVVSADGQTARETVSGLFANLAGVLLGVALAVGGLALFAARRGVTPRRVAGVVLAATTALPRLAVAALFGIAAFLEEAIASVAAALRELVARETTVRELLARLRAWLGERIEAMRSRVRRSVEDRVGTPAANDAETTDEDSYRTLREAWREFLGAVSVRRPAAMTPGELAVHAVRVDDLPADAVATLRDAFRDVEYGARSPADRLARVEDALAAIEAATRPEDDADADGAGGED